MSCCAVVIDSDGGVHYGWESGLSLKKQLLVPMGKRDTLGNGDILLSAGSVGATHKFFLELDSVDGKIDKVDKEHYWMNSDGDEWTGDAILVRANGEVVYINGPNCFFEIASPGYFAIGSGEDFAAAVMWHELGGKKKITQAEAKRVLRRALECACALDDACSLPITIETLEVA